MFKESFFFTTFSLCLLKVLPCQMVFCCTAGVFPEPSRKNMTLRRICHFYKVSFGKTSLNFRSKSYFMNPISHEGYLPSLWLMFCHQINLLKGPFDILEDLLIEDLQKLDIFRFNPIPVRAGPLWPVPP